MAITYFEPASTIFTRYVLDMQDSLFDLKAVPTGKILAFVTETISDQMTLIRNESLGRGSRDFNKSVNGARNPAGDFTPRLTAQNLALVWTWGLGLCTVTTGSPSPGNPYVCEITSNLRPPAALLEKKFPIPDPGGTYYWMVAHGLRVNTIKIPFGATGFSDTTFGCLFAGYADNDGASGPYSAVSADYDSTPDDFASYDPTLPGVGNEVLDGTMIGPGKVYIDIDDTDSYVATILFSDFALDINNHIITGDLALSHQGFPSSLVPGFFEVNATAKLRLLTAAHYHMLRDAKKVRGVRIRFDISADGTRYVEYQFPAFQIEQQFPTAAGVALLAATIKMQGFKRNTATPTMKIILANDTDPTTLGLPAANIA